MGAPEVALSLHDMVVVLLKLAGPSLGAALCVGVVMSLVQAVTQVNEATLAFVPKLAAVLATLALTGAFMLATLGDFTRSVFDHLVALGGS